MKLKQGEENCVVLYVIQCSFSVLLEAEFWLRSWKLKKRKIEKDWEKRW